MKKKILCYVIFISLIFSYCPLVFAEDNIEEVTTNEDNNIVIEQQEQVIDQPVEEVKVEEVEEIIEEDMVVADSNSPTTITPAAVPQAAPSGYWALINLILTVIAGIIAIVSVGKKKEKPDGEPYSEEDKHDIKNLFKYKLFSLLVALGAIVVFILTEDITLPMGYVDNWTLIMVLFPVVEIFNVYFINKIANYDNNKEN